VREAHAFCVKFAPTSAGGCAKTQSKRLGMVLVEVIGLVMKLRGMMLDLYPQLRRANPIYFFFGRSVFLLSI
jgi:hypothetical protein